MLEIVAIILPGLLSLAPATHAREAACAASCSGDARTACLAVRPFRASPRAVVRLKETPGERPLELRVFLSAGGREVELPRFFGSTHWPVCGIPTDRFGRMDKSAIVAGDFAGRGREDLAVVGECMTGIGPAAAEPFQVGAIYVADENRHLLADGAASGRFTELLQAHCNGALGTCDLAALARFAARAVP